MALEAATPLNALIAVPVEAVASADHTTFQQRRSYVSHGFKFSKSRFVYAQFIEFIKPFGRGEINIFQLLKSIKEALNAPIQNNDFLFAQGIQGI